MLSVGKDFCFLAVRGSGKTSAASGNQVVLCSDRSFQPSFRNLTAGMLVACTCHPRSLEATFKGARHAAPVGRRCVAQLGQSLNCRVQGVLGGSLVGRV